MAKLPVNGKTTPILIGPAGEGAGAGAGDGIGVGVGCGVAVGA